jgi:hypothetical protein
MVIKLEVYGARLEKLEKLVELKNKALEEEGKVPDWTLENLAGAILNMGIDDRFSIL